MLTNSGIAFVSPKLPLSNQLKDVNASPHLVHVLGGRPLPSYPPLRLSQILKMIENGSAEAVTIIEWLGIFKSDLGLDDEESINASALLWQAIGQNERVSLIALYMAALHIEGQPEKFPIELIHTLEVVKPLMRGVNFKRVAWLIALREKDYACCLKICFEASLQPFRFAQQIGMPSPVKYRYELLSGILPLISNTPEKKEVVWLLDCVESMTSAEAVHFYDELLLDYAFLLPYVEELFSAHCLPDSEDTLWFSLKAESRSVLKQYFKMSSYYALEHLVDEICSRRTASLLKLTERDIKQLKSRSMFWSNYSEKFNQTRILIPYKTNEALGISGLSTDIDAVKLPDIPQEDSEVFIFDIGKRIIVEVLRGDASELRIFESTSRNIKRLLQDKNLTLHSIREMACGCIHDHVALWQYFCEQMLRVQHGIAPNCGIKRFAGIGRKGATYTEQAGLAAPTESLFSERLEQLETWDKAFWTRESKIKGDSMPVASSENRTVLEKAKIAKFLNKRDEYIDLLKLAASQSNSEAMYLYGIHLLNSRTSHAKDKTLAENLISGSAENGFLPAVELAKKFGLVVKAEQKLNTKQLSELQKRFNAEGQRIKKAPSERVKSISKNILSKEIQSKTRSDGNRPYFNLSIAELEEVATVYSESVGISKVLLAELSHRKSTTRVESLIEVLKMQI